MKRIKETIIVEGRYDANTLRQCVDAHIVETSGFGIFNNAEKRKLLELLAKKNGLIIMTDSDGAGFVIRNHLRGVVKDGVVKHAYIPEISGKERRKAQAGKAGLLGVEGMTPEVIIESLRRAGATFEDEASEAHGGITKQDMYEDGLSGGENSAQMRRRLAEKMNLPKLMSANALLSAMNIICTREEYKTLISEIKNESEK